MIFCRAIFASASMMAFGASMGRGLLSATPLNPGRPGKSGPGGGLPTGVVDSSIVAAEIHQSNGLDGEAGHARGFDTKGEMTYF